ncbi:AMP-binding protein [Planomonospora corallina]|uniref:AMP-binding protein n=1 Tax=Planomonospora corallina TaxID=1806052 RepID=A0ABV8I8B6_9ACTN
MHHETIADLLLARAGDTRPGLRTRERTWSWDEVVRAGACVALTPKFSASGFLPDVRLYGATFFTYVGRAIAHILATPEKPDDADNPLTHAFGTEASPEDRAAFLRRFGCRLIEGYGSSESAGLIRPDPDAPATALGRPAHGGVRIADPRTLRFLPPAVLDEHGRVDDPEEAVGEIVDTEGAARFEGYYKDPAADAERVRHGWYWTGDLWTGRGAPEYTPMTDRDRAALRQEFLAAGRLRFLP